MNKTLKRNYFEIKDTVFGKETKLENSVLTISKNDLYNEISSIMKHVAKVDFEIVKPGESCRIIHLLDTIQPMIKISGEGQEYSGFFSDPVMSGAGITNLLSGFTVMESATLPWDESSASSGLLYVRDSILDMVGPISEFTPFSKTINFIINYELTQGKSSIEYDNEIRLIGLKISTFLASITINLKPNYSENFSIDEVNPDLPNVVLVWQCQNQGTYANTFLYGKSIDDIVPTLLHPNDMLDGCIVSGNNVWPAFKVPTYLHVNHPILLELYEKHGKEINFKGVVFSRSHNPSNWHKIRCANIAVNLSQFLEADGLIMAWEGGGNAATDGMLTIKCAEDHDIKTSTITFEFGGADGTEGILLVDHLPEANAVCSGGSIEKHYEIPDVDRVVGGDTLRLNKESGGYFPPSNKQIKFEQTIHFYLGGNQTGASTLTIEAY